MANHLSEAQRKWILRQYWKCENTEKVRTAWKKSFHTSPPSRQTIYRLRNKFDKTGTVSDAPKSGRPNTSVTEENEMLVAMTFVNSPNKSARRISAELSIPRTSLRRLLNRPRLKPYTLKLQDDILKNENPDRQLQLQMCENNFSKEEQTDSLDKIIMSDEAKTIT